MTFNRVLFYDNLKLMPTELNRLILYFGRYREYRYTNVQTYTNRENDVSVMKN